MKHPSYSTAKNEYLGKSFTRLNSTQKSNHIVEMKSFNDRLKLLLGNK
jgi:hypothetical protein